MSLSVIGSGFGRTGTMSMKLALEALGFGPCHHMEEVIDHPGQLWHWRAAAKGESVDWKEVYAGYGSTVDWPGAHYWRELAEFYPDARVIHTTRSAESWWASFSKTISLVLDQAVDSRTLAEIQNVPELVHTIVAQQTLGEKYKDKTVGISAFEQREKDVVSTIDADRLLLFDVQEGWEPLCAFLGVAVPERAFPHRNDQKEFFDLVEKAQNRDA